MPRKEKKRLKNKWHVNETWMGTLTLNSFSIFAANASKLKLFPGCVGIPSVNTIMTFGLSGLSPPALVNSESNANFKARSVRVCRRSLIGSSAILFTRASLSWYFESAKVNASSARLLNVMRPKWSSSGDGWNFFTSSHKKVITFLRLAFLTLSDLSSTIPMSSPAVHGGAVEE